MGTDREDLALCVSRSGGGPPLRASSQNNYAQRVMFQKNYIVLRQRLGGEPLQKFHKKTGERSSASTG